MKPPRGRAVAPPVSHPVPLSSPRRFARHRRRAPPTRCQEQAQAAGGAQRADLNVLQTQLGAAIAAEDYGEAARLKQRIQAASGDADFRPAAWRDLGVPDWLADRAERLGFTFPTNVQQKAVKSVLLGADAAIRAETGSGKTLAFLLPALSSLDYPPHTYPDDLDGPQCVVIVPHRELGVQIAMLVYRLFGGSVNAGVPGAAANMFNYFGPRGIKVKGCLDTEEVLRAKNAGTLRGAHVVVGTPECLAECLEEPSAFPVMQHSKVVVVDEADECFQAQADALARVLDAAREQEDPPTMVFAGATLGDDTISDIKKRGWLPYPAKIEGHTEAALPAALVHRAVVPPPGMSPSAVLTRLLRRELQDRGSDAPPPRVMAFAPDATVADAIANPLRNALWDEHRIGLVLPDGLQPTKILQDFQHHKTSMLLLTAELARGLDLPAVSHVYNYGVPATGVEYVHRAGRAGRIGAGVAGVVTTIASEAELPRLREMAREVGVELEEVELGGDAEAAVGDSEGEAALDGAKKRFEDLYNLY